MPTLVEDFFDDGVAPPGHNQTRTCTHFGSLYNFQGGSPVVTVHPGGAQHVQRGWKVAMPDANAYVWYRFQGSGYQIPIQVGLFQYLKFYTGSFPPRIAWGFSSGSGGSNNEPGPMRCQLSSVGQHRAWNLQAGDFHVWSPPIEDYYNPINSPDNLLDGQEPMEFWIVVTKGHGNNVWTAQFWGKGNFLGNGAMSDEPFLMLEQPWANWGYDNAGVRSMTHYLFITGYNGYTVPGTANPMGQQCYLGKLALGTLDSSNEHLYDPRLRTKRSQIWYASTAQIDPGEVKQYMALRAAGAGGVLYDAPSDTVRVVGTNGTMEIDSDCRGVLYRATGAPYRNWSEVRPDAKPFLPGRTATGLTVQYTGTPTCTLTITRTMAGYTGNTKLTLTLDGTPGTALILPNANLGTYQLTATSPSIKSWLESQGGGAGNWAISSAVGSAQGQWLDNVTNLNLKGSPVNLGITYPVWNIVTAQNGRAGLVAYAHWTRNNPQVYSLWIRTTPDFTADQWGSEYSVDSVLGVPGVPFTIIYAPVNGAWFIATDSAGMRLLKSTAAVPASAADWTMLGPYATLGANQYISEPSIAELTDGTLVLTFRDETGHYCRLAYSTDGGATFSALLAMNGKAAAGRAHIPAPNNPTSCFQVGGYLFIVASGPDLDVHQRRELSLWRSTAKVTAANIATMTYLPDKRTLAFYGKCQTYPYFQRHRQTLFMASTARLFMWVSFDYWPNFFAAEVAASRRRIIF